MPKVTTVGGPSGHEPPEPPGTEPEPATVPDVPALAPLPRPLMT